MERRTESLEQRRLERLRGELIQIYGFQQIALIDKLLVEANRTFHRGGTYLEVLGKIRGEIDKTVSQQQHRPSPPRSPPQHLEQTSSNYSPSHPLPLRPPDDWAAVSRSQDAAVKLADERRQQALTQRKIAYKQELEQQINSVNSSAHGRLMAQRNADSQFMAAQAEDEYKYFNKKAAEANQRFATERENFTISLQNKQMRDAQVAQSENEETSRYLQSLKQDQERQHQESRSQFQQFQSKQAQINAANESLIANRKQRMRSERELNRSVNATSIETKDSYEPRRRAYLQRHERYHQQLAMQSVSFTNSPIRYSIDEESRILDHQSREEEAARRRDAAQYSQKLAAKEEMVETLNAQIREQHEKQRYDLEKDQEYARRVQSEVSAASEMDKEKFIQKEAARRAYNQELQRQIDQTKQSRQMGQQMTEAERKLNQHHLDNFHRSEAVLQSSVPGHTNPPSVPGLPLQLSESRSPLEYEKPVSKRYQIMARRSTPTPPPGPHVYNSPKRQEQGSPSPTLNPKQYSVFRKAAGHMIM